MSQIVDNIFDNEHSGAGNSSSLFIEESPDGYFSAPQLIADTLKLKALGRPGTPNWRLTHNEGMFSYMKTGKPFIGNPRRDTEDGLNILWVKGRIGNTNHVFKISEVNGLFNYINDYALGRIKVEVTFRELLNKAVEIVESQN